jgi:excisionase family DNA binding protein
MSVIIENVTIESPWMTTADVADYIKVPIDTVRAWRYKDAGPIGHKVGRHVRYHREDVDAWMRSAR